MMNINTSITTKKYTTGKVNSCTYVMLHHDASSDKVKDLSAVQYLATNAAQVSCNYVVVRTGEIRQIADDKKVTWHAGVGELNGIKNTMNNHAIGIEVVSDGYIFTEAQMKAVRELISFLIKKHNIPVDHIIRHADYTTRKRDIGPNFYGEYKDWKSYQQSFNNPYTPEEIKEIKLLLEARSKFRHLSNSTVIRERLNAENNRWRERFSNLLP